ncbi:MAG: hypothetical protein FI675_04215 [SAR202 cluster bacterium]|nr:hypothetical protein [SAR202 cluster bacterium]|tara:strand:+ start:442 stop:1092 length:651 start_codon:yes stop_codon:yes gene_type:complete
MNVRKKIKDLGSCIELVSMDPFFNNISVGIYKNNHNLTIWSFSNIPNLNNRIEQIRDNCAMLGDIDIMPDTHDKLVMRTDLYLERALKFMFTNAVQKEKNDFNLDGPISSPDTKTKLKFFLNSYEKNSNIIYKVSAEGESEKAHLRIRAVVGGFMKYAGCERVSPEEFMFSDGKRYDKFARLILPIARNVSATENMLSQNEMQGQMTTQTLGFSQT